MRITNPQNNRYQSRICKRFQYQENTSRLNLSSTKIWKGHLLCWFNVTTGLRLVDSQASTTESFYFIKFAPQPFGQNSEYLLHNCVFFGSFNSRSRFLFGSFVEGSSKGFFFLLNIKICYVRYDTTQFETKKNKNDVCQWVLTEEKALSFFHLHTDFSCPSSHLIFFPVFQTTNWRQNV